MFAPLRVYPDPDPRGFITDADVWRVSDTDFQGAVRSALAKDPPREGEDTYYLVLFSHDPLPVFSDKANLNAEGYHSQLDDDGRTITYGAVLNWSANTVDNIWNSAGSLPAVFAHEVVEACTDPANGFRLDNGQELADLNDSRSVQLPGIPQPISLAAYWSQLAGVAVVPTSYSLRIAFGLSSSESRFFGGPLSSMRKTVLERVNP
jgi:hypothetical protein